MPIPFPGTFSSGINTQDIIEKLQQAEAMKLNADRNEIDRLKIKKEVWNDLKLKLQKFDNLVNELYGFRRVFRKRIITSDAEDSVNASVMDNTLKGNHVLNITHKATAHKILSEKVSPEKILTGGIFILQIGEDKIEIKGFEKGGSIKKLADVLQDEAEKLVKAAIVQVDSDNVILSIESVKTGEKNKINITGNDILFKELGLNKQEKTTASLKFDFNNKKPENLEFNNNGYSNTPCLLIQSRSKALLPADIKVDQGVIEFLFKSSASPVSPQQETEGTAGGGITQKSIKPVQIRDVTIYGADIILTEGAEGEKKPITEEKKETGEMYVEINGNNTKVKLNLTPTNDWKNFKAEVKDIKHIESINFVNDSSSLLLIDNVAFSDKTKGKTDYKNIAQEPTDAKITVDGIEISRDKNNGLDDIFPGVSLNLLKETSKPVNVEIKEDTEKIITKLDDFVKQYNDILSYITEATKNPITKNPASKIKGGQTEEERAAGIMVDNTFLKNFRSALKSTIVNPYLTSLKQKLETLTQIGISTGEFGNKNWDKIKAGVLIIDKEKFTSALNSYGDKISEIFGYDSNNDRNIDTGVGFKLDKIIQPFLMTKGVIATSIDTADATIKSRNENIAKKEGQMKAEEQKLRSKFRKMEQNIQSMKNNQNSFDNQNKSSGAGEK